MKAIRSVYFVAALLIIQGAIADAPPDLVEIQSINPRIRIDLRYATADNFLGKAMYEENRRSCDFR